MIKKLIFILFSIFAFVGCSEEEATDKPISIEATNDSYTFVIGTNAEFTLKIFSKSGNQVFEKTFTGDKYQWDKKNENGTTLADGMYLYTIANTDKSVNQSGYFYIFSKD